ncbi:MAG: glutathione S-transferase [Pseudomonadales bacterium]|jgi:glutathione S-transferase|nr:glutathione S-transferase [Pseudomonadales bacterium]
MYRLHGFPLSNYYNMVKMALIEKGLPFEEIDARPSQDGDWLARSPMGKVPALETDAGFLTETQVILDYLEETMPEPALLPADPFARAKVRELARYVELYVELPARRCFAEVFFGGSVSDETKAQVREALPRGMASVKRLARFSPWIAGDAFSQADIMWHYSVGLASQVARKLFDMDLTAGIVGAAAHREAMGARASAQRIQADRKANA